MHYLNMKIKRKWVDIIDLKFFSSLKWDGVYKKGTSWAGPRLLKDSQIPVPYLPWHQHPSINQVLENHCLFTNILDVKNKTATCQFGYAKSKRKAIKSGTAPWALKKKRRVDSKFNDQIKKYLFIWIMNHPQVVKHPIVDYCLKVNIYFHTET